MAFGQIGELVTDTQIILTNVLGVDLILTGGSFNGPVFDFIGSGNLIQSVALDPASNVTPIAFTLTPDGAGGQFVQINLEGLPFPTDSNVTIDVSTAAAVPEPSTLVLAGVGALVIAGYAVRRRCRAK